VPANPRSFHSVVTRVDKKSDSLRVTVPGSVSALLGISAGDTIVWTVQPGSGRTTVTRGEPIVRSGRRH
jgi:hypothetical protein